MRRHTMVTIAATAALGLTACSGSGASDSPSSESAAATTTSSSPSESSSDTESSDTETSASPSSSAGRDVVDDAPDKDWQEALDAARDEFSGEPSKIELESAEDGDLEYKIELISKDSEYTVQFDAGTLDKLSDETEDLGDDAAQEQSATFDPADLIDLDAAVGTARDEQDGAITSWKLEGDDDGSVQYEFDILPDGATDDIEVQVDAADGSIVKDS